jgi:hypothetical protein
MSSWSGPENSRSFDYAAQKARRSAQDDRTLLLQESIKMPWRFSQAGGSRAEARGDENK